jgi:hypothetical protein
MALQRLLGLKGLGAKGALERLDLRVDQTVMLLKILDLSTSLLGIRVICLPDIKSQDPTF